ncbi:MAG: phage regulatory CII family protein [Acetobacter sp.]|uniref:phage regulatory CII family protein n=1 Tax=Acetobacter sp. TaxID=440 RepID=UPI003F938B6E
MTVPFSARFVGAIKNATLKAVNAIHDFEAAAGFTRVSKTQLHGYTNKAQPVVIPLDVAMDLDQAAGHAPILTAYAGALGYVVVPLHVGPGDFGEDMSAFAIASGDVLATAMRILDDGRIDLHEAHEIAPKLMQGKQILERALAYIHNVQTENQPRIVSDREAG